MIKSQEKKRKLKFKYKGTKPHWKESTCKDYNLSVTSYCIKFLALMLLGFKVDDSSDDNDLRQEKW